MACRSLKTYDDPSRRVAHLEAHAPVDRDDYAFYKSSKTFHLAGKKKRLNKACEMWMQVCVEGGVEGLGFWRRFGLPMNEFDGEEDGDDGAVGVFNAIDDGFGPYGSEFGLIDSDG